MSVGHRPPTLIATFPHLPSNHSLSHLPIFQPFLSEEIIGGHEAKPHSHPYMALIQFLGKKSWKRCGGVLIQKDFVLTAAPLQREVRGSSQPTLPDVWTGTHPLPRS